MNLLQQRPPHSYEPALAEPTAFDALELDLVGLRHDLMSHELYPLVDSIPRLRVFMQVHVFAVWDFMSLVKRLQADLAGTQLPWRPPVSKSLSRFINEVVLTEESDQGPDGEPESHLEIYLGAMEEIGAPTRQFRTFLEHITAGASVRAALRAVDAPRFVRRFVSSTIECAIEGSSAEVASSFLFGREDLIPDMFQRILRPWPKNDLSIRRFRFYLERHIELDGDEHGPIARRALTEMAGTDDRQWKMARKSARRAIISRVRLWDGVCRIIREGKV